MMLTVLTVLCTLLIDSFNGNVLYKPQGAKYWSKPTTMQSVTRLDSMQIASGASVTFVDDATGVIYECKKPVKAHVNKCIHLALEDSQNALVSLAAQIKANALGQNRQVTMRPVYGGSTRTQDENLLLDSVACLALSAVQKNEQIYSDLNLHTIEHEKNFSFCIANESNESFYVNVLSWNTVTRKLALTVVLPPDIDPETLLLSSGQRLDLDMFRFIKTQETRYILFATKTPYSTSGLQNLLLYPEDIICP